MKGRRKLRRYLAKHRLTQEAFAALADVPGPQVSLWLRGERKPGLASAFAIQQATAGAVRAEDWLALKASSAHAARGRRS